MRSLSDLSQSCKRERGRNERGETFEKVSPHAPYQSFKTEGIFLGVRTETAAEIGFDDRCRADGSDIGRKAAPRRCTTETVRIKNARSGRFNIHLNQTELLKNSFFNSSVFRFI